MHRDSVRTRNFSIHKMVIIVEYDENILSWETFRLDGHQTAAWLDTGFKLLKMNP